MDGFTPPKKTHHVRLQSQAHSAVSAQAAVSQKKHKYPLKFRVYQAKHKWQRFYKKHQLGVRVTSGALALFLIASVGLQVYDAHKSVAKYQLSDVASSLLGDKNDVFAQKLHFDAKTQKYLYNDGYTPTTGDVAGQVSGPRFTAELDKDPVKGIAITDAVNQTTLTIKPKFGLDQPQQQDNRVIYPLMSGKGARVITLKASLAKEDIILEKYQDDTLTYNYELSLPDELEARQNSDGSIGVFGPAESALMGNVSTGSQKDADLLQKARQAADKSKLIFKIPAPFIVGPGKKTGAARAWYSLDKNILTVHVTNLKNATYPLTIDPSVYIETAAKLMKGNNETNVDFDVTNELIQKGKTTGGRFDAWNSTMALPSARWNHGTAVAGGYIYVVGGNDGTSNQANLYWAKFNATSGAIESPDPGAGTCTNWCTSSAYDLPGARAAHSLIAYNGFLYVLGGLDGSGARTNTVYISKIGANGEPSLWHPSGGTPVYWYPSTNTLPDSFSYSAAIAYNNRLYILGGQTSTNPTGDTIVREADLKPTGDISSWTSTGMVALPIALHNHSAQVYNDRMYIIGGNSAGTLKNTVYYIKIKSDGTMQGSWNATTSFGTARMAWGGVYSSIWGAFIYVAGGCTAINGSGYCTTIANDIQLASVNADGTITNWVTVTGITSQRMGYGLVAWQDVLYGIGGCTAQNTTTGACTTTATLTQYGTINQDGDASTVNNSVPSGTSPCVTTAWTQCDMPPLGSNAGQGGQLAGAAVVNNGFIYYIGGCTAVGNNSVCFTGNAGKTTGNISYSAINPDGSMTRSASCVGTYYGSWCVDNVNKLNGGNGLAAFGYTIFNNTIYAVGGTDGTTWQSSLWYMTLNADGSLNAWTTQTFASVGIASARGYSYVFARANPASAGTNPGNLYVLGGCIGPGGVSSSGLDCSGTIYSDVYKCNITTTAAISTTGGSTCTTTGQLQIDSEPSTGGTQGLGVMAGTVYANYIYLIGGQSPNQAQRGTVMYAKIDSSNNIVDALGGSIWQTSPNSISPVRTRGVAYGYNGYLYALAGYNTSGGGSLNDLLYAKINVSDGSIGSFITSSVTVNPRWDLRATVNDGYVYTLGGCSVGTPPANCTTTTATIQTFQLYNNYSGSPAGYSAGANLFTTDRIGAGGTVYNGYMYIAGGCTSATDCSTATNNVQYAAINADGSLGTWANTRNAGNTADSTLGASLAWGKLVQAGGTLYYIGGQTGAGTAQTTVYYGAPLSTGNVTAWSTATNGLPAARTMFGATVWNNRMYVVGGLNATPAVTNTVYVSPQLNSGGDIGSAWSTSSTSFSVARSGLVAVSYANNLYVFGGFDGTNYLNDAQFSQINSSTGDAGSWTSTTSLPLTLRQGDGFAANGFMYIFGGRSNATTCGSVTLVAPISANTTIASGNNPTGVGEWYQTNARYTGNRYGAAAVYNEGKAYLLGGGCGATLTYTGANRIVQTTLQAQPQVAKYSRMIDTDTDVFPTKWLMNGLDNSIGARWLMRYRSSTAANGAWGQETNYGAVTLGTPATYTPLDGSGTNTNFARYYYMSVSIDSSQAYGYPEDVSRGPTIADLSLFFTADPSKRMRHGKTFTGGQLQPLDTPF